MDEIEDKIKKLETEYTDPDDLEVIQEWRGRLRKSFEDEEYLGLGPTKALVAHLRRRMKDIKIKLSSTVGMEKVDNLALHAKFEELASLFTLLAKDPKRERASLDAELSEELSKI